MLNGPGRPREGLRGRDRLMLAGLALLAFLPALFGDFVWDDLSETFAVDFVKRWENLPDFFTSEIGGYYRPLRSVVYLVGWTVFGQWAPGFHALSLLWHALATVAAGGLAFALGRDRKVALAAGALFAVHPIHAEPVAWVSAFGDPLAALLGLLGLTLLVEARRSTGRATGRLVGAGALVFAACLAKEAALAIPVLAVAIELVRLPGEIEPPQWRDRLARIGAAVAPAALYFLMRTLALQGVAPHEAGVPGGLLGALAGFARVCVRYLRLMVAPFGLSADWVVDDYLTGPLHPATLGAVLLMAALVVVAVLLRRRAPLAALGVLWFYAALLPVSNVVPLNQFASEKYLYLPSFGACLALGWGFVALVGRVIPEKRRRLLGAVVGGSVLLAGLGLSMARSLDWRSEKALWSDTLAKEPANTRARFNLAKVLWEEGFDDLRAGGDGAERGIARLERAEALLGEVRDLAPDDAWALTELGRIRGLLAGRALEGGDAGRALALRESALIALEEATVAAPDWARPRVYLGSLLVEEGRRDDGRAQLETAQRLDAASARRDAPATTGRFDPTLTAEERALLTGLLAQTAAPPPVPRSGPGQARPPGPRPPAPVPRARGETEPPPVTDMRSAREAVDAAVGLPAGSPPATALAVVERAVEAMRLYPRAATPNERLAVTLRLGRLLVMVSRPDDARAVYTRLLPELAAPLEQYPDSADLACLHAEALFGSGDAGRGTAELERCEGLQPDHPQARALRRHYLGGASSPEGEGGQGAP